MKRKMNTKKVEQFIINVYNNPNDRQKLIEALKTKKDYKGYLYNNIVPAIYTHMINLIEKATYNQPITDSEKNLLRIHLSFYLTWFYCVKKIKT